MKKQVLLFLLLAFVPLLAKAQILEPVKWQYSSKHIKGNEYELTFRANIEKGWYIYVEGVDVLPAEFIYDTNENYQLIGKTKPTTEPKRFIEEAFGSEVATLSHPAIFTQRIKTTGKTNQITGSIEYMSCNMESGQCIPLYDDFKFALASIQGEAPKPEPQQNVDRGLTPPDDAPLNWTHIDIDTAFDDTDDLYVDVADPEITGDTATSPTTTITAPIDGAAPSAKRSQWAIFIAGFVGGLIALLTPCVFPMIPLTVSFFTKQSGTRARGISRAAIYGASIIVIYVILGFGITKLLGPSATYEMAVNPWINLAFFALFIVFAVSFFGAFELTLPSKWVNKMDNMSDRGGLIGIFFMAFTLALVSFSCTGPIIGTLLVESAYEGGNQGPLLGMFGFSVALAMPFTLFAIFPSWLQSLPKSGGWLNSVKIVLGFLELALAMKFLSNADMVMHWNLLPRDIYISIWIVIFGMLGFYLLGKIKFSHDTDSKHVSIPRLFFAIVTFAFTVYLIPGLWGSQLSAISGWLPPQKTTSMFAPHMGGGGFAPASNEEIEGIIPPSQRKYADKFHCPPGFDCYFDLEEGLAAARILNKPVLLDFTGWTCANCRKMEASVWPQPEVARRLRDDYIIISLYVDDRSRLAEEDQYISETTGKRIRTIGQKWHDYQISVYNASAQPYYVLLNHDGTQLNVEPRSFDENINAYVQFLDAGVEQFKAVNGKASR